MDYQSYEWMGNYYVTDERKSRVIAMCTRMSDASKIVEALAEIDATRAQLKENGANAT